MPPPVKLVLDGTLFAECQMQGANRDGMMRLTEDITNKLIVNNELDISFASTLYIEIYDSALKSFIRRNYPTHTHKIFSKNPLYISNLLKWKGLFRTTLANFPISPSYKEVNEQDIFHSFYYPFSKTILKNIIKKSITFLDIIPLKSTDYPQALVKRTKQIVESIVGNYAMAISDYSKQDLLNYDNRIKEENVFVVPLAAEPTLFYQNKNSADWEWVRKKYNLPERYFLCVSGKDARKNIPHVIKSFNNFLEQENYKDIFLVLTGNTSHNYSLLDELNIADRIRSKIYMPDKYIDSEDLAVLYSNAVSFFFMSLYEGFGLPALEAMQCGTPTIVANATSLPEVVGDGGLLLSPTDVDELSNTMNNLYKSETLRTNLSEAGLKRAATFSWQRTADEYAAIFKKISAIQL